MTIPDLCKQISQNLTHNLRLAKTDDERREYLSHAMKSLGEQVIPPLNLLFASRSEGDLELVAARTAALELATIISGNLVRSSTNYQAEVSILENVLIKCNEPQLKRKLLFYTNHLKKRWLEAEPGGLAHNPRAKKIRTDNKLSGASLANVLVTGFCLAIFLFVRSDLIGQVFPSMRKPQQFVPAPQVRAAIQPEKIITQAVGNPPQKPEIPVGAFYTFTDNQGVVHMVDDLYKVPLEYRKNMKVTSSGQSSVSNTTPVIIKGNQVLVPVTITFRGRSVETLLLLDTGASTTAISEVLAAKLGIGSTDVKESKTTVADGRSLSSYRFSADTLGVAAHMLTNADATILSGIGGKGYEGLLGMNYLKHFRFHVNFKQSVIEWGG